MYYKELTRHIHSKYEKSKVALFAVIKRGKNLSSIIQILQ